MSFAIIPVIDLLDGQVVHARGGIRANYSPIQSPLCPSPDPVAVLTALLTLHPFTTVYIADLGAMLGRRNHDDTVEILRNKFPHLTFWLDNGQTHPQNTTPRLRPVIGTETGISADALRALSQSKADFILSLDFNANGFMGDTEILSHPDLWSTDIIIMSLPSVGTAQGPEWPLLDGVMPRNPALNYYMAGGVRDNEDLAQAQVRGLKGALVATALHTGKLESKKWKVNS